MDMRVCTGCHRTLSLDQFHKQGRGKKQYYRQPCKDCRNAANHQAALARQEARHATQRSQTTKACNRCRQELPIERFYHYPTPSNPDYRWASCKTCTARAKRAYLAKNPQAAAKHNKAIDTWRTKNLDTVRQSKRTYKRKHPEQRQESYARWRARIKNAPAVEKIDRQAIYERDRWICQLCFKKVNRKDASLDHVIPLARGGAHTAQNQVLAHRWCNSEKGARAVPQQMRLY